MSKKQSQSEDDELAKALAFGDYSGYKNPARILADEIRRLRSEIEKLKNKENV